MRNIILLLLSFLFSPSTFYAQNVSPFIHVDQFGYANEATKVAVISNPQAGYNEALSYSPSSSLEVRRLFDNTVVYSGAPLVWSNGSTHNASGDAGWWFDFSEVNESGIYFLIDPVYNERSAPFEIGPNIYHSVVQAAAKMFYYNRCNMAKETPFADPRWTDGNNFLNNLQDGNARYIYDQGNAALEKDLQGGWFDAGDYNKYVTFASSAVHMLLSAYEDQPQYFGDNWNIPESGNNLPDLLDEVKWELDWLLRMANDDGSVIIKMGNRNYDENILSPPSANTEGRYYGPACTSSTLSAAAMFAHGAAIFDDFPEYYDYSQSLLEAAIAAWNQVLPAINSNSLETDCDDGSIVAGDADMTVEQQLEQALIAAYYLYQLTSELTYHNYFIENINDAEPIGDGFWSGYKIPLNDVLLGYTTLNAADIDIQNQIRTSIEVSALNNWNNFFGFVNDDLYRAYMPDWAYHWGSSLPMAGFGVLNLQLVKYGILPDQAESFRLKAKESLHYFHGVNPQGLVYLSNMYELGADQCINEIYHTWFYDGTEYDNALTSPKGPAPGYVTGGANQYYDANTSLQPPYNQPLQKSYLDFNTGWPDNSWEISEPAIYYQAFYLRLAANVSAQNAELSSLSHIEREQALDIYPNPSGGVVQIELAEQHASGQFVVFNLQGKELLRQEASGNQNQLELGDLPKGVYFISYITSNGRTYTRRLILH